VFNYFQKSFGCDVCGCGIGGSYIGIIPQFNNHFFGVRYKHQEFNHKNVPNSLSGNNRILKDVYQTTEFWGRYNLKPGLQFFYSVPYVTNKRIDQIKTNSINGIGDIQFSLNYIIYNSGDSTSKKIKILFYSGTSVKLPTGKYQKRNADKLMYPVGIQPGNGSWGNILNFGNIIRYKSFGLSNEWRFVYNHTNELGFKPGNQYLADIRLFYWKKFGFHSFILNSGTTIEKFDKDLNFNIRNENSGGIITYANVGADLFYKKFMYGVGLSVPWLEQISPNLPTAANRIIVNISYFY
jgi:hypothetical protein